MAYVEKNLMQDEEIIYRAKIHWMIYLPSILFILLGSIFFFISINEINNVEYSVEAFYFVSALFFILGIFYFLKAFIYQFSTELVVTSKRVIAKFGLVQRNTMELNHSKVESLSVNQTILQRILNGGTIVINGTGSGKTPIPNIDEPLVFRTNAMEAIDKN